MKKPIQNPDITCIALTFAIALLALPVSESFAQDDQKKEEPEKKEEPKEQPIFPDKNLEKAVRQQVFAKRHNDEPIYAGDVKDVSTINGKGLGITSLAGLEHCRALASLELADNQIVDLSPIKELKGIQLLDLANNQIEDIAPIAGIIAIQYLEISENNIKTLEPVRGLERLSSLYASNNQISDISPVLKLPKLSSLYLDNNQIKDIAGIGGLTRVTSFGLRGNQIKDISPLKGAQPRSFLFLEKNQITDLAPLIAMCKEDLEGQKRFAPYANIYLRGNPLRTDAAKAQLREMKELKLRVKDMWE
jgi:internalin A